MQANEAIDVPGADRRIIAAMAEIHGLPKLPDLLGMRGIAKLFGVSNSTVRMWKSRGLLPPPDEIVDGTMHVWASHTVRDWVREIQQLR